MVWSGNGAAEGAVVFQAIEAFRTGATVVTERDIKAERGAYFVQSDFVLDAGASKDWVIAADLGKSIRDAIRLQSDLDSLKSLKQDIFEDIEQGSKGLISLIAQAMDCS